MKPSDITIIVLNWNNREETVACLESLRRADLGGASVIVVDNGSRDGSVEAIGERFPEFRLLTLPENRGYAGGNNAGMRLALAEGAEGVLLLNNDAQVAPDFLLPLLWAVNDNPRTAAVCGAVLRMDRPEVLDVAYAEVDFNRRHAVSLQGVNALPAFGFDQRREVQAAVGCNLLLSAEALRTVGLFDEAYFAYHEDIDWCLRARKAGFQIFFEPYSRVFHRGSSSTRMLNQRHQPNPVPAHRSPPERKMFLAESEAAMLTRNAEPGTIAIRTDTHKTYVLQGDDPSVLANWSEYFDDLPNAEPLPWNPVRTYLGARNLVRLLRTHATREQRRAFVRSCLRELPLELFALVLQREGWMRLGRWGYRDMMREYFIERHSVSIGSSPGTAARLVRAFVLLVIVPVDLFWSLPSTIWQAHRLGRLGQYTAYVRGLFDGFFDRPIPFERLGLRP